MYKRTVAQNDCAARLTSSEPRAGGAEGRRRAGEAHACEILHNEPTNSVELVYDLVFTLPGIPQLYSGDELAMYGGADPDNRRDLPATTPTTRGEVFAHIKKLTALRTTVPALAEGEYHELWRQNGAGNPNVYAFSRGTGNDARIVVVNNGASAVTTQIPVSTFPANTALVDELDDGAPSNPTLAGGKLAIPLPARSAAIYRRGP